VAGIAAVALALSLGSVVAIWHDVGSVVTSALLLPVVLAHASPRLRPSPAGATAAMVAAAIVCTGWILSRGGDGRYFLALEPIFPPSRLGLRCGSSTGSRTGGCAHGPPTDPPPARRTAERRDGGRVAGRHGHPLSPDRAARASPRAIRTRMR